MTKKQLIVRSCIILAAVLFAVVVASPLQNVTIKVVDVTEKFDHGQWIKGKTEVVKLHPLHWLMKADQQHTTIVKEYEKNGVKYRVRRTEYIAPGSLKLGLDLRGGAELLYRIRVKPEDDRPGLGRDMLNILSKRIDPQGVLEYRLQLQGAKRILIQVPGAGGEEIERIKRRITTMGKLEFRLCTQEPAAIAAARRGEQVPGYHKQWVGLRPGEKPQPGKPEPRWFLVENRVRLTGEYLADVYPTYDYDGMRPAVGFQMNARGAKLFGRLTDRHIGAPLAILLDDKLVSAPIIRARISKRGIITGNFTQDEVNDLVATLRAGSLPADLELEMDSTVGPSLGSDSIRQSILAIIVGSAFVFLFVAVYYKWAGCVADLALALNLVFVIGALALFNATLTLPGIAGLVLTVGMAIDANVLIFERIREEKAQGKLIKLAIKNGYGRAFTTILDANLTTLITAVILYIVGTGPVRGFAVTLSCGIVLSMFTALYVTRTIFEIGLLRGWVTELSMRQMFARPSLNVMKYRKLAASGSAACILVGMVAFFLRGEEKYDIDFTGGTLVQMRLDKSVTAGMVRKRLKKIGYGDAEVQNMWSAGEAQGRIASDFGIRIKGLSFEQEKQKIIADFKAALADGPGMEGLSINKDRSALLKLKRKTDELDLRQRLAKADYRDEDIPWIAPRGVKSDHFAIWWGKLAETPRKQSAKNRRQARRAELSARVRVLKFIQPWAVTRQVKLLFGQKIELPKLEMDARARGPQTSHLTLRASEQVDKRLIQAMVNQIAPNVQVLDRGAEGERSAGRRFDLSGKKSDLEQVRDRMPKSFEAPAARFTEERVLTVKLKQPMDEKTFVETVLKSASNPFPDRVRRVAPLGAKADQFDLKLARLRPEKVQEKIRSDLLAAFKDKLVKTVLKVEFKPVAAAAPAKAKKAAAPAKAETKVIELVLDRKVSLDRIKAALDKAGCPDALATKYPPGDYDHVRLRADAAVSPKVQSEIRSALQTNDPFRRVVSIGSVVAGEMKQRAYLAMAFAMFAIVLYIWMRFGEIKFGIAAVIALFHDVLFATGAVAVAGYLAPTPIGKLLYIGDVKINLPLVAAFLTIVGYSLNDTIVIFDRIRENLGGRGRRITAELLNNSINQTLSRTILTSLTTFGVVLALYVLGGSVIHGFAFALLVGVVVGTYSSIYIASPVLLEWKAVSLALRSPFIILGFLFKTLFRILFFWRRG